MAQRIDKLWFLILFILGVSSVQAVQMVGHHAKLGCNFYIGEKSKTEKTGMRGEAMDWVGFVTWGYVPYRFTAHEFSYNFPSPSIKNKPESVNHAFTYTYKSLIPLAQNLTFYIQVGLSAVQLFSEKRRLTTVFPGAGFMIHFNRRIYIDISWRNYTLSQDVNDFDRKRKNSINVSGGYYHGPRLFRH